MTEKLNRLACGGTGERRMTARHEAEAPPPGWRQIELDDPFNDANGPFYFADPFGATELEPARIGFRIQGHNCSFAGVAHGGVLVSVLDIALGHSIQAASGHRHTPTMSLVVDFMRPADLGDWLESRVRLLRMTRRVAFCDATLLGPHGAVARGSGVFKLPSSRVTSR
jgi:acyl-coenzyme A thioesterase PaaI-like protein